MLNLVEKVHENGIMSVNGNLDYPMRGSGYMANNTSDKTYVTIGSDEMEAYLYLTFPEDGADYTLEQLLDILRSQKVISGIRQKILEEILARRAFGREILVASGVRQIDGVDGRYEYAFNTNPPKKPTVRSDGTVDYLSVFTVQTIAEGETIAVYYPATIGKQGKTVTGKVLEPKRGKELLPLKGKGFQCKEDKVTYVAIVGGKIEFQNNRILITNLFEIKEDLDFNNGKVEFRGDIVIHGNVENAGFVKAGGSITIDGNVEGTTIIAGKDIILRKGMQGSGKSKVQSGGSIFAKFIEGCSVEAKMDIQADVLMNSSVTAGGNIIVSGNKATILGGVVKAVSKIEVLVAGNDAETQTKLMVGIDDEIRDRISKIKIAFKVIDQKLVEIDTELEQLQKKIEQGPQFARAQVKDRIKELLRNKIKYISDRAEFKNELTELEERCNNSQGAYISVNKCIYPGVTIQTNMANFVVREKQYAMQYRYEGGEVAMYDLHNM